MSNSPYQVAPLTVENPPTTNVIPFPLYDRLYRIWEEADGPETFPDRTE